MAQPILSICIPTYDRARPLRALLESIDSQGAPSHLYEVRVRDNASVDDSAAAFRAVAKGRPNWHWAVNERNCGGRANIRLCTLDAQGQFTWIVGSDDRLESDALAVLLEALPRCKEQKMTAMLLCHRLPAVFARPNPIVPPFLWLRYVSINVPAFITAVVWDTSYWRSYPYENYPLSLSLPQLDAFVEASLTTTIYGFNRNLVEIGNDVTTGPSYWYQRRFPYDNVFEYPLLYQKVLHSPRVDLHSRVMILLRRFANVQKMYNKLLVMRYNQHYYHVRARDLKAGSGTMFTWPLIFLMAKAVLEWPIGARIAARACRGFPVLPAREKALDFEF